MIAEIQRVELVYGPLKLAFDVLETTVLDVPPEDVHQVGSKFGLDLEFYVVLLVHGVEVYELLFYVGAELLGWKNNASVEVGVDVFIGLVYV
jgi:hypothetical protein